VPQRLSTRSPGPEDPSARGRQRAAVFSLNEFPSHRAHVGAIVGMANTLQSSGLKTTLYAYFRPNARKALLEEFGLEPSVRLGWSSGVVSKLGKFISLVGWSSIAATRRHDVILTRNPVIALAARRCDLVLLELHQELSSRPSKARARRLILSLLRTDRFRFVFISNRLQNHYLNECRGLRTERCVVAPSGFRRDWFPETWSPSPRSRIVTYAGSLYRGRGIELVLAVARDLPNAQFRVIGGSSADWSRLTTEIEVPTNCIHIPQVAPVAIPKYLIESDILLAPYQHQVLIASGADIANVISPLKIVEYLAAGRAIVASDLPAIREIVTDSEIAILIAPDDVALWTESVRELLKDHATRDRFGERAFWIANGHLDWHTRLSTILSPE
jgi:glycosyltransferase involved in cell wall biosynthesis